MGEIKLLDCTLRDGGYVNDWEFGHNNLVSIFERVVSAGVDIIEVGFLDERRPFDMNRSIMPDSSCVEKIYGHLDRKQAMVVGMIDYGTCGIEHIQPCSESYLDGIRVIFKKHIRWQAIDFRENTITISRTVVQTRVDGKTAVVEKDRAKNKKSYRTLPLVPQYKELLLQMRAHQEDCRKMCGNCWQETSYVYVNDMGQPVKPNYVTQHFQLVLQKTGMRKITFHELRHTCASLLLKSGVPMKNIQEWLGHSSYSTTANIYAHLDAASKKETSTAMAGKLNISGNLLGMQSGTTLLPAEEQRKELG